MDQGVIDRAVDIATTNALNGHPVERIIWIPPSNSTSSPNGSFVVQYRELLSTTESSHWSR